MEDQITLTKFVDLRQQEIGSENGELIEKLEICVQSIHRWLQYCQYHFLNIENSTDHADLVLDRVSKYQRKGENVSLRYVYEANIAAFLNSLHSLLDSFPYLLNLFITVCPNYDSTKIKWDEFFLSKYNGYKFYDDLNNFMLDSTFHKVKGYVNTIKHKHLIRIANKYDRLEFEDYYFKRPVQDKKGKLSFQKEVVNGQNVLEFIPKCHNELIPKFFDLCNSILRSKGA